MPLSKNLVDYYSMEHYKYLSEKFAILNNTNSKVKVAL